MDSQTQSTSPIIKLKTLKRKTKFTSSGRESKTPKRLMTTSEEEGPRSRNTKTMKSVAKEKEDLRILLQHLLKSKHQSTGKATLAKSPDNLSTIRFAESIHRESSKPSSVQNTFTDGNDDDTSERINLTQKNVEEVNISLITSPLNNTVDPEEFEPSMGSSTTLKDANVTKVLAREITSHPTHTFCETSGSSQAKIALIDEQQVATNEFRKQILERLQIIENQNARILELVAQKTASEACLSDKLYELLPGFPLETMEEFNNLNDEKNFKLRKKLQNYLKSRGGTKLREFLSSSLRAVMVDKLVSQFTWLGNKKYAQFGNTRFANVLYHAAQKCPYFPGPLDKTQFKVEMLEVLQTTKQRICKLKKKVQGTELTVLTEIRDKDEDNYVTAVDFPTPEEMAVLKRLRRLQEIENSSDPEDIEQEEEFCDGSESSSDCEADDEEQ